MNDYDTIPTLFEVNGVPVKVKVGFWPMVVMVWALLAGVGTWRWPGQSLLAYVLVGGVGMLLAMLADVGHACAHTVGARMADAPTQVVMLGADMPRTLYSDKKVEPGQHIARSLGGPVYSWIGFGIGLLALSLTEPQTAAQYLAEIWTVTNGFIGAAIFAPLPIVDGGVIVKWLLVMAGRSEEQADQVVRRVNVVIMVLLLVGAVAAAVTGWWGGAAGLVIGAVVFAMVLVGVLQ